MSLFSNRWFNIGGIVAIAFVFGAATSAIFLLAILGKDRTSPSDPIQIEEAEPNQPETNDSDPGTISQRERTNDDSMPLSGLADLSRIDNEFDRTLELYLFLSKLDKNQLVEMLRESVQLEPDLRLVTRRAILQRLAILDSKLAFSHAQELHPRQIETVFVQWSVKDVNEAIANAKTLDRLRKSAALRGILKARDDLPEDILLQIGKELDNEAEAQRFINSAKTDDYLVNPRESWYEVVDTVQNDPAQLGLLHELAQTWFEQEGLSVIDQINRSLTNNQARNSVLDSVLKIATKSNPQGTFQSVLSLASEIDIRFVENVAQTWALDDLNAALSAVDALEFMQLREHLLSAVMKSWVHNDPHALLESVAGLSEVARGMGEKFAIREIAKDRPDQAAQLIARVSDSARKRSIAHSVVASWLRIEPNAALDWVLSDTAISNFRQELLQFVLPNLAKDNPHLAFDTALAQPAEEGRAGLESIVISRIAHDNMNTALELLPRVRDGKSKTVAYAMVGSELVTEGSPMDAMRLSQQLPEADQETFFLFTMTSWAQSDPKGLVNSISDLPSQKAQSKAAAMLLFTHRFEGETLTDSQIERVEEFLSDKDAESLKEGGMSLLNPLMNLGLDQIAR